MRVAQELCGFALGGRNVGLVSLPGPVARGHARYVHARVVAQPQDILQRHHHQGSVACQRIASVLGAEILYFCLAVVLLALMVSFIR